MQLFKYVIAVLILCGIPDIILFRLFYKWRNKTLKSLQWTSVIILLVVFSFAMIARYFTVSMVPMLAFGFVVMFLYPEVVLLAFCPAAPCEDRCILGDNFRNHSVIRRYFRTYWNNHETSGRILI